MSRLFGLARQASEYVRNRFQKQYRDLDRAHDAAQDGRDPQWKDQLRRTLLSHFGKQSGGSDWQNDLKKSLQQGLIPDDGYGPELGPRDFQLLGRDAGYHEEDFAAIMTSLRRTPVSSNVYGYFFERESRRSGILYVTFLYTPDGINKSEGPGPTYAYYDVPVKKALEFQKAAATSGGGALWDYLRIRDTLAGHQHQYRLVHVTGEYVPRKATPRGYRRRAADRRG